MNNTFKKFSNSALKLVVLLLSPIVLTMLTIVILSLLVASIRYTMGASFYESYNIVMSLPGLYMLFGVVYIFAIIVYVSNETENYEGD